MTKTRMSPRKTTAIVAMSLGLLLVAGTAVAATGSFRDVEAGSTHAEAIAWAQDNGITSGCTTEDFCPEEATNRAQMVSFLRNLAEAGVVDAETVAGMTVEDMIAAASDGNVGPQGPEGPQGPTGEPGPGVGRHYSEIVLLSSVAVSVPDAETRPSDWYTLGGYVDEQPAQAIKASRPLSRDILPEDSETLLDTIVEVHEGHEVCVRLSRVDTGEVLPGSLSCHEQPGTDEEDSHFVRLRSSFTLPETGTPEIRIEAQTTGANCPDDTNFPCLVSSLQDTVIVVKKP